MIDSVLTSLRARASLDKAARQTWTEAFQLFRYCWTEAFQQAATGSHVRTTSTVASVSWQDKLYKLKKIAAFHTHAVNVHCKFLAAGRVSINQLRLAPVFHECTSILLCVCITQHRIHLFGNGGCQKKEERMEDEVK